jgi:hypothetical protein
VKPSAKLVADPNQLQRVALGRVALMDGSIADLPDVVEPAVHALSQEALVAEHLEPLALLSRQARDADLDERSCGERLAELPTLDHSGVQVSEDGGLRRRAIGDQQRFLRKRVAEVGSTLGKLADLLSHSHGHHLRCPIVRLARPVGRDYSRSLNVLAILPRGRRPPAAPKHVALRTKPPIGYGVWMDREIPKGGQDASARWRQPQLG